MKINDACRLAFKIENIRTSMNKANLALRDKVDKLSVINEMSSTLEEYLKSLGIVDMVDDCVQNLVVIKP